MLKQAIEDYLLWMMDKGYSHELWQRREHTLGCFSAYVKEHQIQWENIFTSYTVDAFIKQHTSSQHARQSTEGLWRYLLAQRRIDQPLIEKKPLPEVYEAYLFYYGAKVLPDQVQEARKILSALNDYLRRHTIALLHITISDLDNFLALYTASFIPKVRQNKRYSLAGFLRYIYYERGILTKNLAPLLQGRRIFSCAKPPKFLRAHELQELFKSIDPRTSWELRAYAMLHLACYLGLRSKEISVLTLDDISFGQAQVILTERKNTVPIILPLPEYTIKAIAAYIVGARPKTCNRSLFIALIAPYEPLCSSVIAKNISKYIRKVNPSASAYWLRHTYAQNLLEKGASIFEIKEMLGHESIQSTEKYLHIHTTLMREALLDETL